MLQALVERTVTGMGYELVDVERGQGGLLTVYLDHEDGIDVEDCKRVSDQLSYLLMVENIPYERLEVSSPGVDRPLKTLAHYLRFADEEIKVKFREPLQNQRTWKGILHVDEAQKLSLQVEQKPSEWISIEFTIDEVEKANLVPVLNFKGVN